VKTLYIIVEGQTEEEFVKQLITPFSKQNWYIQPIKITTNRNIGKRGGFTTYRQLKDDIAILLKTSQEKRITTFVDFFRIPKDVPNYENCSSIRNADNQVECLENAIKDDINHPSFFPYIQKFEFEALLFSSNKAFENNYGEKIAKETARIIKKYLNPEDINDSPNTSPSNRIKAIIPSYNKPNEGNKLALEIGIQTILEKCPRFKIWFDKIIEHMD
jgi:hypothetical protein